MITPIEFIKALAETDIYIEMIYMQGGCYQFYRLLKTLYPQAVPYLVKYDDKSSQFDHVITEIDGRFYDITGEVTPNQYKECRKLTKDDLKTVEKWSFSKKYFFCSCFVVLLKNQGNLLLCRDKQKLHMLFYPLF